MTVRTKTVTARRLTAVAVAALIAVAFATAAPLPPSSLPNADSPEVERLVDMGAGCKIRLLDPFGGSAGSELPGKGGYRAAPPAKSSQEALGLSWDCVDSDDPRVGEFVSRDATTGTWRADTAQILVPLGAGRPRWMRHWFAANYRVVTVKSVNAAGYAIVDRTQNEFSTVPAEGDKSAQRSGPILFNFCLVRAPKAICGGGQTGVKQDGPKGDLTPFALRLVRSIAFVD